MVVRSTQCYCNCFTLELEHRQVSERVDSNWQHTNLHQIWCFLLVSVEKNSNFGPTSACVYHPLLRADQNCDNTKCGWQWYQAKLCTWLMYRFCYLRLQLPTDKRIQMEKDECKRRGRPSKYNQGSNRVHTWDSTAHHDAVYSRAV